jgi:hypothetical protein
VITKIYHLLEIRLLKKAAVLTMIARFPLEFWETIYHSPVKEECVHLQVDLSQIQFVNINLVTKLIVLE